MKSHYITPLEGEEAESQKIFCMVQKYIIGKEGLDIGCGGWKVTGSTGIDIRPGADITADIAIGLDKIVGKTKKYDYIFSSHLLEDFTEKNQIKLLKDWINHLREKGYLIIYVPEKGQFKGCNVAHKKEFQKGDLEKMFKMLKLKISDRYYDSEAENGGYGILLVGQKYKDEDK